MDQKGPMDSRRERNQEVTRRCGIYRLPVETLGEIFILCNDDKTPSFTGSSPLGLSHVSSIWRATALNTPRLWSSLNLRNDSNRSRRLLERIPHLPEFWFGRAKNRPLSFSIMWVPNQVMRDVLKSLSVPWITSRIVDLRILHRNENDVSLIFRLPPGSFISLKSLYLSLMFEVPPTTAFSNTPLLRRLELGSGTSHDTLHGISWSQITHLNFEQMEEIRQLAWYNLMCCLPNLQWGSFRLTSTTFNPPSASRLLAFNNMAYLRLHLPDFYNRYSTRPFPAVDHMEFPVLETYQHSSHSISSMLFPSTCLILDRFHPESLSQLHDLFHSTQRSRLLKRLAIHCIGKTCLGLLEALPSLLRPLESLNEVALSLFINVGEDTKQLSKNFGRLVKMLQCADAPRGDVRVWIYCNGPEDDEIRDFFKEINDCIFAPEFGCGDEDNLVEIFKKKALPIHDGFAKVLGWVPSY